MKKKTPFRVNRLEKCEKTTYEITTKEDIMDKIIDWISKFVADNRVTRHNDMAFISYLNEMRQIYGKFLDHYNMSYNFASYDAKIAKIARDLGLSPWQKDESNT